MTSLVTIILMESAEDPYFPLPEMWSTTLEIL